MDGQMDGLKDRQSILLNGRNKKNITLSKRQYIKRYRAYIQ